MWQNYCVSQRAHTTPNNVTVGSHWTDTGVTVQFHFWALADAIPSEWTHVYSCVHSLTDQVFLDCTLCAKHYMRCLG